MIVDNKFRLQNLRLVSQSENMMNQIRKNGRKGIRQMVNGTWQARIACKKVKIHLGTFKSKKDARAAYHSAVEKYHGEYGRKQ